MIQLTCGCKLCFGEKYYLVEKMVDSEHFLEDEFGIWKSKTGNSTVIFTVCNDCLTDKVKIIETYNGN